MPIERVLAGTSETPLIAGLQWRPVSGKKPNGRTLAEAKRLTGASHFVLHKAGSLAAYGLYVARPSEDDQKLPKGVASAAAAFALMVGAEAPNAALVLRLPHEGHHAGGKDVSPEKFYVVLLEDGVPVTDVLTDGVNVRNQLGKEDRSIFSNDQVLFPHSGEVDLAWLEQGASAAAKAVKVQPIPMNPVPMIALTLVVVMAAGGYFFYAKKKKEEEQRKMAEAAAQADPVPKYLGVLATGRDMMTTDRAQMLEALAEIFKMPVVIPGWVLASTECSAETRMCSSAWLRKGGTFEDVEKARPGEKVVLISSGANAVPGMDQVMTQRPFEAKRSTLLDPEKPLPAFEPMFFADGPLLQVWRDALIVAEYKAPLLWPSHPEVPQSFTHPQALMRGQVAINGMPAAFTEEAIRTAPRNISWEYLRVDVTPGTDPKTRLKVELKGYYYVSKQPL